MTDQLLGYCGLSCTECPAYIAKRTDDQELRINTAKEWSSEDLRYLPPMSTVTDVRQQAAPAGLGAGNAQSASAPLNVA